MRIRMPDSNAIVEPALDGPGVGVAYSTGEEFDASWDRGDPLEFQLGAGRVIAGWDQGVQGMKVGGRRQLIIPPDLA
jgi:peptidylprolyl isomerase